VYKSDSVIHKRIRNQKYRIKYLLNTEKSNLSDEDKLVLYTILATLRWSIAPTKFTEPWEIGFKDKKKVSDIRRAMAKIRM